MILCHANILNSNLVFLQVRLKSTLSKVSFVDSIIIRCGKKALTSYVFALAKLIFLFLIQQAKKLN